MSRHVHIEINHSNNHLNTVNEVNNTDPSIHEGNHIMQYHFCHFRVYSLIFLLFPSFCDQGSVKPEPFEFLNHERTLKMSFRACGEDPLPSRLKTSPLFQEKP
eukprot:TRINITY_DN14352_c0_g1_i1.p1 TRINITY_DN14352_c0_g1~~TRINITY_DN14352_c0_g1_i1.p1  ORF type:complete len:103 (-),score=8.60 TRINITY_DN14352_c0_g1_i1:37-345(-)